MKLSHLALLALPIILIAACVGGNTTPTPSQGGSSDPARDGGEGSSTSDGGARVDDALDGSDTPAEAGGEPKRGGSCGALTCAADEICVLGCRGFCLCDEAPETGTCPLGPCSCGAGCEPPPPPSRCEKSVPSNCTVEPDGSLQCICG